MYNTQKIFRLKEQRRNPRITTSNQVGYKIFSSQGERLSHGKGKAVNLSQNGALLETEAAMKGVYIMLMTIDVEGNNVYVKGRIIYSLKARASSRFLTGIEFVGPRDEQLQAITSFVRAYQRSKHKDEKNRVEKIAAVGR